MKRKIFHAETMWKPVKSQKSCQTKGRYSNIARMEAVSSGFNTIGEENDFIAQHLP